MTRINKGRLEIELILNGNFSFSLFVANIFFYEILKNFSEFVIITK